MIAEKRQAIKELTRAILKLESRRDAELARINGEIVTLEGQIDLLLDEISRADQTPSLPSQPSNGSNGKDSDPLVDYVSKHRKVDYGALAHLLYGSDTVSNRNTVQSRLHYLAKKGLVKKLEGRNEWELVQQDSAQ